MKRLEKQGLISDLNNVFQKYSSVMVVHYKGLTVAEMESLRKDMSKHDISLKVVKNSLASIATSDTQNTVLNDFFFGPTRKDSAAHQPAFFALYPINHKSSPQTAGSPLP